MKLIVDVSTSRVLIGHTKSPDVAETIQIVGDAIRMQTTKADFDVTIAVNQSSEKELMTMRVPTQHYVARVPEWADQKYSPNTMFRAAFHLLR